MWTFARQHRAGRDPGNIAFGAIGWLFADLMLALVLTFLATTTIEQPTSSPSPTPGSAPGLHPDPVIIKLTEIDWKGLARTSRTTRAAKEAKEKLKHRIKVELRQQLRDRRDLARGRAGMVLTFGGAKGGETGPAVNRAEEIAKKVNTALRELGTSVLVFDDKMVCRPFVDHSKPPSTLKIEVYVFKK